MREAKVRLDGWCEGGLGQQRNDGGDCAKCVKDRKEWRALVHMQLNEFHMVIFAWPCVLSYRPPMLWWLSHGERREAITSCVWDPLWKKRSLQANMFLCS